MNFTLFVNKEGYILNNNDECELSDDDHAGINYIKKK